MRKDMKQVLIERPRHRDRWNPEDDWKDVDRRRNFFQEAKHAHETGTLDELDFVDHHRMHMYSKEFSDLIGPLQRYFESCVGRTWTEVHSEIYKTIDRRSMQGEHLYGHAMDEVHYMTKVVDGEILMLPYPGARYRGGDWVRLEDYHHYRTRHFLYRDPNDDVIRRYCPKSREYVAPPKERIDIDKNNWYEKVDGIWYKMTNVITNHSHAYFDLNEKRDVVKYWTTTRLDKKQLNSKELRVLNVTNDLDYSRYENAIEKVFKKHKPTSADLNYRTGWLVDLCMQEMRFKADVKILEKMINKRSMNSW